MKPFAIALILIALASLISPTSLALTAGPNALSRIHVTNLTLSETANNTTTTMSAATDSQSTNSSPPPTTVLVNSSSTSIYTTSTSSSTTITSTASTASSSESSNSTTYTSSITTGTTNSTETTTLQTTTTLNQTSSTTFLSNSTSTQTTSANSTTTNSTTTSQSTTHSVTTNSTTTSTMTTTTSTVQIIIDSYPEGAGYVNVDGLMIGTPHIFNWTAGSTHTLSASSAVSCGSGCQYSYQSWSDDGTQSHNITVPNQATTYKATFYLQYYLTTFSNPANGGLVTPTSGWYNYGTQILIQADASSGYTFVSWTSGGYGSYNGNSRTAIISIASPMLEVANFQYTGTSIYSVTFEEYNIPLGVTWGINVGSSFFTTTSTSITIYGLTGIVTYAYQNSVSNSNTQYLCQSNCSGTVSDYATVSATYAVQPILTPQTQQYGTSQILVAEQATPSNIVVDNADNTFWTNENGELLKLSKGSTSPIVLLTGLQDVQGLGVDSSGNIYYSEYLQGNLYRLSAGSSQPQLLQSNLKFPSSISVDLNGNVYFITGGSCGDKITKLDIKSNTLTTILTTNSTGQAFSELYVHPSGDLYYATCNNYAIDILPAGSTTTQVLLKASSQISGIWVDSQRNIFYVLSSSVNMLPYGASNPLVIAKGLSLHGIALDSQGNIYYVDTAEKIIWELPNLYFG